MINPTTDVITEFATASRSHSFGITAGPDGNLWFTGELDQQIDEIDPTTDAISEFPIPVANSDPQGITAGPDGNLWFAEPAARAISVEFNPTTDAINEFSLPAANGSAPRSRRAPTATSGSPQGGHVGTINPTTDAITEYAVPYTGSISQRNHDGPRRQHLVHRRAELMQSVFLS